MITIDEALDDLILKYKAILKEYEDNGIDYIYIKTPETISLLNKYNSAKNFYIYLRELRASRDLGRRLDFWEIF